MTDWEKRIGTIFPYTKGEIKYDTVEAISYATPHIQSLYVSSSIQYYGGGTIDTIVEACGGLGSDTITFGSDYKKVYTCELDKERFECLKHNISLFKHNDVHIYNENFIDFYKKISLDKIVVAKNRTAFYIDMPWGGENYLENQNINNLSLDSDGKSYNAKDLANMLSEYIVAFKVPKSHTLIEDSFNEYGTYVKKNSKYIFLWPHKNGNLK